MISYHCIYFAFPVDTTNIEKDHIKTITVQSGVD
jgi:hypothetical protein